MIVVIDPNNGHIVKYLDFEHLYPKTSRTREADSFNGIAYNRTDDTLLLTGKLWPKYYRVQLVDVDEDEDPGGGEDESNREGRRRNRRRSTELLF